VQAAAWPCPTVIACSLGDGELGFHWQERFRSSLPLGMFLRCPRYRTSYWLSQYLAFGKGPLSIFDVTNIIKYFPEHGSNLTKEGGTI